MITRKLKASKFFGKPGVKNCTIIKLPGLHAVPYRQVVTNSTNASIKHLKRQAPEHDTIALKPIYDEHLR